MPRRQYKSLTLLAHIGLRERVCMHYIVPAKGNLKKQANLWHQEPHMLNNVLSVSNFCNSNYSCSKHAVPRIAPFLHGWSSFSKHIIKLGGPSPCALMLLPIQRPLQQLWADAGTRHDCSCCHSICLWFRSVTSNFSCLMRKLYRSSTDHKPQPTCCVSRL